MLRKVKQDPASKSKNLEQRVALAIDDMQNVRRDLEFTDAQVWEIIRGIRENSQKRMQRNGFSTNDE